MLSAAYLLCSFILLATGTVIDFEGTPNPDDIKSGLTPELKLRCSLKDNPVLPTNAVIGRDVTQTSTNVQQVSSIIIMQNGVDIASVTVKVPAKPLNNSAEFTVTGDVTGTSTERGFIELSWLYPNQGANGEFTCEASSISDVGHAVVFSTTLDVEVSTPDVVDLVNHIRQLEIDRAATKIEHDQEKLKYEQDKLKYEQDKLKYEQDTNSLQKRVGQLEAEKDSLTKRIDELSHTEVGYAYCGGDSNGWSGRHGEYRYTEVRQNFKQVYNKLPIVQMEGLPSADIHEGANTRYHVYVVSVDEHGFTMRCETWDNTHIYSLRASWISIPQ